MQNRRTLFGFLTKNEIEALGGQQIDNDNLPATYISGLFVPLSDTGEIILHSYDNSGNKYTTVPVASQWTGSISACTVPVSSQLGTIYIARTRSQYTFGGIHVTNYSVHCGNVSPVSWKGGTVSSPTYSSSDSYFVSRILLPGAAYNQLRWDSTSPSTSGYHNVNTTVNNIEMSQYYSQIGINEEDIYIYVPKFYVSGYPNVKIGSCSMNNAYYLPA